MVSNITLKGALIHRQRVPVLGDPGCEKIGGIQEPRVAAVEKSTSGPMVTVRPSRAAAHLSRGQPCTHRWAPSRTFSTR
jgi:hypothetical protein